MFDLVTKWLRRQRRLFAGFGPCRCTCRWVARSFGTTAAVRYGPANPCSKRKAPLTVSHRPGNGRHRLRRMPIGLPSAVGSLAVAAAASGAVTMPQAVGATTLIASDSLTTVPERPHATDITGALEPVEAAGESLTAESAQLAKDVNAVLVELRHVDQADGLVRLFCQVQAKVGLAHWRRRVSAH